MYKFTYKVVEIKGNKKLLACTHTHKRVRPLHMKV